MPESKRCRHGYDPTKWLPCPTCKPEETAVLRGAPSTPEQHAVVAVKSAAMRNGIGEVMRNPRTLKLEGETLAGCQIGKTAHNSGSNTRFHAVMACGHEEIVVGTTVKFAHKKGQVLRCKACAKQYNLDQRIAKKAARKRAAGRP